MWVLHDEVLRAIWVLRLHASIAWMSFLFQCRLHLICMYYIDGFFFPLQILFGMQVLHGWVPFSNVKVFCDL